MIKKGELDIIVGTHSLLGNRVVYNNLGLLVVDEEQVCLLLSFFLLYDVYVFAINPLLVFMVGSVSLMKLFFK